MKLLAIETSSDACSVAVQAGEDVIDEHVVGEREHTSILVPMIGKLLQEAGLRTSDLDAVVLGNGPGSFIGMRIGASVAQGICYGADCKLLPVSSLAAVAAEAIDSHGAENVLVAQDARMHEVYIGRYRRDGDGLPIACAAEEICTIGHIKGLDTRYVAAGAAWCKFPELLAQNQDWIEKLVAINVPRARYLLGCGADAFRKKRAIDPEKLAPLYIRVKVAERPL